MTLSPAKNIEVLFRKSESSAGASQGWSYPESSDFYVNRKKSLENSKTSFGLRQSPAGLPRFPRQAAKSLQNESDVSNQMGNCLFKSHGIGRTIYY